MNLGCHLSIAKGFNKIYQTAESIKATNFQFFSRNPRGSSVKIYSENEIEKIKALKDSYKIAPVVAHLPYTVNPASPSERAWQFAKNTILKDLTRMSDLNIKYLVLHPGSYAKSSLVDGLSKIVTALEYVFNNYSGDTILCLETMAGKGTEIGRNFSELKCIFDIFNSVPQLGICLDSCHLFSSGYNFLDKKEVDRLVEDINNSVGLEKVYISHLNDSKMPCGSFKDRHEKICEGMIGTDGITNYISNEALKHLPFILETPVDNEDEYRLEIEKVLALL